MQNPGRPRGIRAASIGHGEMQSGKSAEIGSEARGMKPAWQRTSQCACSAVTLHKVYSFIHSSSHPGAVDESGRVWTNRQEEARNERAGSERGKSVRGCGRAKESARTGVYYPRPPPPPTGTYYPQPVTATRVAQKGPIRWLDSCPCFGTTA